MENQDKNYIRPSVSSLDKIIGQEFKLLDHGFIRLIDYMGDDAAIVQAARVSYGVGTKTVNEDRGLIRYLMKHKHTSPFEMCEIKFHIKLPMFIARQWVRHRTASINEYSARYSVLSKEFYIPEKENMAIQAKNNKQGRGAVLEENQAAHVSEMLRQDANQVYETYEKLLATDINLAREIARTNLSINYYTEWYWKIDLHNLLHFLRLRMHSHAQYEIRVYAEKIAEIVKEWCPLAFEAFEDYAINSVNFSALQIKMIKRLMNKEEVTEENSGLSKRDYNEVLEAFRN
jgi:thymidylate synthase (FAD)